MRRVVLAAFAACVSLAPWFPAHADAPPIQMGMRVYAFRPPGSNVTTILYGIYGQWALDPHWIVQGELDYASWVDLAGQHNMTTVPVSGLFHFLPGRPFDPYAIAGLNYTSLRVSNASGISGRGTVGGQLGVGFGLTTQVVGFSLEGRYFVPDLKHPEAGSMVWGGGASLGLGVSF